VLRPVTRRELLALASLAALAPRASAAQGRSMPTRERSWHGRNAADRRFDHATCHRDRRARPRLREAVARRRAGGRVIDTWPRSDFNDGAFGEIISAPDLRERLFITINLEQQGAQAGREHFERTLRLYQRERIDLLNVGSLIDLTAQWLNLRAFKDDGRARYIGVTAAQAALYGQLEAFLERERPDFVEINYSVTEREAERRLLPLCADRGIAVLISRPFMNGAYFERLANVPLPDWAAEFECASWAQFSLQYILANPAVTCVLTETTRAEHMAENALWPSRRCRAGGRAGECGTSSTPYKAAL
jgi:diketogulonate reductase-like aldo/keto reductase